MKNICPKSLKGLQWLLFLLPLGSGLHSFSQGTWTQKSNFGGAADPRWAAVGFSIGTKGYIGTGFCGTFVQDFWEWDQATDTWTQKANFGGGVRWGAIGFSIGTKGYIGTGTGNNVYNDFWEWDQATNIWTQKANVGGSTRFEAVAFSIGTKGYVGMGQFPQFQDFWEWNQATNVWTQKANFGGGPRNNPVGFSIGTKGYVGTGSTTGNVFHNDFWEWNQATNVWSQKANFPGGARIEAVAFSAGNYGYMGTGTPIIPAASVADFFRYDPASNTWTPMANFGGGIREFAVGFSIGCRGYVGTGLISDGPPSFNDLWEFCPDTACCNSTILNVSTNSQNVLCNGQCTGTATANVSSGTAPYTYAWSPSGGNSSAATGLCAGTYTILVSDAASSSTTSFVTITQPTAITVATTSAPASCGNNDGTATANASAGTPAYTYSWSNGQTTKTATGLAAGNYTATVTDANGCTKTQTVAVSSNSTLSVTVSSTQAGCAVNNGTASAIPTNGTAPYTYNWSNGSTTSSATGLAAGNYSVIVADTNGCAQTLTVAVTGATGPIATATATSIIITPGSSVTLTAGGGGTYSWSPSLGLSCTTCQNPVATPSVTTIYCVVVTDTNNCTDSVCVTITVDIEPVDCSSAGELFLPNAFSPNNDLENDVLQLYFGDLSCIKTFSLAIYDRWGEKVFETSDPAFTWDGSYKNKMANTSVFVYYLTAELVSGVKVNNRGNVSLLQ